jgi:hypothetical protein
VDLKTDKLSRDAKISWFTILGYYSEKSVPNAITIGNGRKVITKIQEINGTACLGLQRYFSYTGQES